MSKKLALLVAVLTITSVAFAQSRTQAPAGVRSSALSSAVQSAHPAAAVAPATTSCAVSYTSGAGQNLTTYCVTVNGNVIELSRGGEEMISVGTFDEGYGICDTTTNVSYWDYAWEDSGNLLASSFSTPTLTQAVSTRVTSDGLFKITNTITKVAANGTAPGQVKIKMAVQNLTGITRGVYIVRHVDIDANNDTFDNVFNWDINTVTGSYAVTPGPSFGHGLAVVNTTFGAGISHNAYALNEFDGPQNVCNIFVGQFNADDLASQPFTGDGSAASWYFVNIPKLATKTITLTYQPI